MLRMVPFIIAFFETTPPPLGPTTEGQIPFRYLSSHPSRPLRYPETVGRLSYLPSLWELLPEFLSRVPEPQLCSAPIRQNSPGIDVPLRRRLQNSSPPSVERSLQFHSSLPLLSKTPQAGTQSPPENHAEARSRTPRWDRMKSSSRSR